MSVSSDDDTLTLWPASGAFSLCWVIRGDGSTQRDERHHYSGLYTVRGDRLLLQADTFEDEDGSRASDRLIDYGLDSFRPVR